jgi:hypothetical protein
MLPSDGPRIWLPSAIPSKYGAARLAFIPVGPRMSRFTDGTCKYRAAGYIMVLKGNVSDRDASLNPMAGALTLFISWRIRRQGNLNFQSTGWPVAQADIAAMTANYRLG